MVLLGFRRLASSFVSWVWVVGLCRRERVNGGWWWTYIRGGVPEEKFPFVRFRGSRQPSEQVFGDGENRGDGSWKRKRGVRGRQLYHAHVDTKRCGWLVENFLGANSSAELPTSGGSSEHGLNQRLDTSLSYVSTSMTPSAS